jgi:recombinational DNA repair protein RecR
VIVISTRGIAVGDELEYADEVTWEKYIAAGTFRKIIQKIIN